MPYKTYQEGGRKSTRGKDSIKEEESEMKDVANTEVEEDEEEKDEDVDEESGEKKKLPWLQRTKEGKVMKTPKDVQKRRRNYRLKKMLTPKAPLMVLHELLGATSVQYELSETSGPMKNVPTLYTAKTQYDGKSFTGMGPSKVIAKNICAEQVLQYITTKSCENKGGEGEEKEGDQENGDVTKNGHIIETDTPWVSLASLALFKLFNDWQAQGYHVPVRMLKKNAPQQGNEAMEGVENGEGLDSPKKPKKEKMPQTEKTLPENAKEKHPVQLLNEMFGPLEYEQTAMTGEAASSQFTMAVTVNDVTYSGMGKSKKEAKKSAAVSAIAAIYNIQYPATV